ncbi:MAG: glucosaminidase domain-containing protein [Flavobacteriales bacterium]
MRPARLHQVLLATLAMVCCSAASVPGQPDGDRLTAEAYIELWKAVAVRKMQEHGIPASITLAQGLLESGNGNSKLAREANNHFGIKCTPDWTGGKSYHDDDKNNDCFRKYRDAAQSYEDHAKFLLRPRYAALFELKPTDYEGWAKGLKKAGYATDPAYPQKLIALIERYRLHELDRGVDVRYASTTPTGQRTSGRGRASAAETITIGAGRQVDRFEGRIKFVRAKAGDTYRSIADDLEMTHGMLARWNDADRNAPLAEGQRVYIQPKRNASKSAGVHVAKEGESLWGVSQQYGVKLARLAQYNGVAPDARLEAGQRVNLRKPRR